MKPLIISDINIQNTGDSRMLSASIDGEIVYFSVPLDYKLFSVAECFLGVALLEAMISNRKIIIEDVPISKKLFENIYEIQSIYSCWNRELNIVTIDSAISDQAIDYQHTGSFFSAGIDSSHALLRHENELSHLILLRLFDAGNEKEYWEERIKKQTVFAKSLGLQLIPVESNVREWTDRRKISFDFAHGLLLSSLGGALGMRKVYIPSSHTYSELFPWGSHPVSDPLWSTDSTTVVHDGAGFRRSIKVKGIINNRHIANNIQVCWKHAHKNCGVCSKCIRTMIVIHLLGGETDSLPELHDMKLLEVMMPDNENSLSFLIDVMQLAKITGNMKVYNQLKRYHKKYHLLLIPPMLDRLLFGNVVKKSYYKFRRPEWIDWRVTLKGRVN